MLVSKAKNVCKVFWRYLISLFVYKKKDICFVHACTLWCQTLINFGEKFHPRHTRKPKNLTTSSIKHRLHIFCFCRRRENGWMEFVEWMQYHVWPRCAKSFSRTGGIRRRSNVFHASSRMFPNGLPRFVCCLMHRTRPYFGWKNVCPFKTKINSCIFVTLVPTLKEIKVSKGFQPSSNGRCFKMFYKRPTDKSGMKFNLISTPC